MSALLRVLPIVLALGAVGVVVVQRGQVSDLDADVERLRRELREADEEPILPPLPQPRPLDVLPEGEEPEPAALPDDVPTRAELRAVRVRLNDAERRLSLAMTVLDGLTAKVEQPAEAAEQDLATELEALRADVDDLLAERDGEAARREAEEAQQSQEPAAEPAPPAPPPTLGERWRALRESQDRTWIDGVTAAARLTPQQAEGLRTLVGDLRASQETTLQQVWRGEKSLVDAQIELDELERQADQRLRRSMSLSQLKAYRKRLVTYPTGGLGY